MNNIKITEITSSQIEEYKSFLAIALQEEGEKLILTENDNLYTPFPTKDKMDSFTVGAYINSSLVGVASFNRDGEDKEKLRHKGVLSTMYVAKEFRGRGIARRLLEEVIRRAKDIPGIEQINLIVISDNERAKGLYEKFGFKKFGTEENSIKWNDQYISEDLMVLRL